MRGFIVFGILISIGLMIQVKTPAEVIEGYQKKRLSNINVILASPSKENLHNLCPKLCNNLMIGTEHEVYGNTTVSCHKCAGICGQIAKGKSRDGSRSKRALINCHHKRIPMILKLSPTSKTKLRSAFNQLKTAIQNNRVRVVIPKTVTQVQREQSAVINQPVTHAQAQTFLVEEQKDVTELITDTDWNDPELDDMDLDELVSALLEEDAYLEGIEQEKAAQEEWTNAMAMKLKQALSEVVEEQYHRGNISSSDLRNAKKNLKKVFKFAPAPKSVVEKVDRALKNIIVGIRGLDIDLKASTEAHNEELQSIVDDLRAGVKTKPDAFLGFSEAITTPGFTYKATKFLKEAPKPTYDKAMKFYDSQFRQYKAAYDQLQLHQKQELEKYAEWTKKYKPSEYAQAKRSLEGIIKAIESKNITIKAKDPKEQPALNIIDHELDNKRPLSTKQKRTLLNGIRGGVTLKAKTPNQKTQAAKGNKDLSELQDDLKKAPTMGADISGDDSAWN